MTSNKNKTKNHKFTKHLYIAFMWIGIQKNYISVVQMLYKIKIIAIK